MNVLKIKKRINIEILSKSLTRHVPVIQNDRGRIIECYITDCQIPTGTKVKFWAMKPSGKLVYNDCTLKDNVVSIELTNQTLAEKGLVACQIEFDGDVSSYEFFLDVERDISGNGTVSENESTVLDALLEEMRVAIANVKSETEKAKAATAEAKKATEEAIKATQESQNPIKEVAGSDITVDQTHQGAAIIKELQGGTKQEKTNGYQLFDASKLPTKSAGGATVTNNGDGSFTISGSGNITENINYYYEFTREEALKLLKVGTLTLNTGNLSYPLVGVLIHSNSHFTELNSVSSENVSAEITQDMLDANDLSFRLRFYAALGHAIVPGTIKPMLYQDGDGTWEPFTGGEPSPNPDNPQFIHGLGDMGYFDGELLQGRYYNGNFLSSESYVASLKYECNKNDIIKLLYEKSVASMEITFWNEENIYLKLERVIGKSEMEVTAPATAKYFAIVINKSLITTENVNHITVTINGKYAVKVKTHGKNLIDFEGMLKQGGLRYSISNENEFLITTTGTLYSSPINIFKEDREVVLSGIVKDKVSNSGWRIELLNKNNEKVAEIRDNGITKSSGIGSKMRLNYTIANAGAIFKNIMVSDRDLNTLYQPYKESISYITLDAPLYEGDRIYLEDGELWEYRENARVVFDGSEDEIWSVQSTDHIKILNTYIGFNTAKKDENNKMSIAIKGNAGSSNDSVKNIYRLNQTENNLLIDVDKDFFQTLLDFTNYLKSNPIEFVYKLKSPTLKKLGSAEAFNLRTFDERTYIEVSNSKELGTENTFIVPRNQSGGLITDAFATSKRNEINAAGQADLVSRISALEQLAVKESV